MIIKHIVSRIFGDEYDFSIPAGPALVYFYRRFGFTEHGSDADKWLCRYVLPTAVDGLWINFSFGGVNCYIGTSMSDVLEEKYHNAERRLVTEWWERCNQWADGRETPLLVSPMENISLFVDQAETWLTAQGITEELTEEQWSKTWSGPYYKHRKAHNDRVRDAYKQIEPFPERDAPNISEFGKSCETAVENVLRDLLRPVAVRDVYINVLGHADLGEYDEEHCRFVDEAERSYMAGYGIVVETGMRLEKKEK